MFSCLNVGKPRNQFEESSGLDGSASGSEEESHAQQEEVQVDPKLAGWEKCKAKKSKAER